MQKLWKVCVNNWEWNRPHTLYGKSREECEKMASKFPASDTVKYAGMFRKENAEELIELSKEWFYE